MKDINDIIGIKAYCEGVVEHGIVETIIDDKKIRFSVQQCSNGIDLVLLDTDTPEVRELLKGYGVVFEHNSDSIVEGDFTKYVMDVYANTSITHNASWMSSDYETYNNID